MASKKKTDLAAARDLHKDTTARLMELDPQTHPAEWRDTFKQYVQQTEAVIGHVIGDDSED